MADLRHDARFSQIKEELKELLISSLALEGVTPEAIKDDEPLFGEGLALDSLDAVEIVVLLQRNYGLEIKNMDFGRKIFQSINTLTEFICENTQVREL